jgi:hypothetical protein
MSYQKHPPPCFFPSIRSSCRHDFGVLVFVLGLRAAVRTSMFQTNELDPHPAPRILNLLNGTQPEVSRRCFLHALFF